MFNGLFKLKKTKDRKILNESGGTYIPSPIRPPPPYGYPPLPQVGTYITSTSLSPPPPPKGGTGELKSTRTSLDFLGNIIDQYMKEGKELELLSRVYKSIREYKEGNR